MIIRILFSVFTTAIVASVISSTSPARAGETWDSIRQEVYGNRNLQDGRHVIKLSSPYRPEDLMQVRLQAEITLPKGRTIKTIAFVVDNNPSPVAARFTLGQKRQRANFATNIRLNEASDVHVVVEADNGELYVVERFIKFAGGQSSCAAPPSGDPKEIIANMGKMKLNLLTPVATSSNQSQRVAYELNHPNHTGMVLDQITLLYVPLMMVSKIEAWQGRDLLFEMDGSITMSQNPSIEFDFLTNGTGTLTFKATDTQGHAWSKTLLIGPGT